MEVFLQTCDALERVDIETYTAARGRGGDMVRITCSYRPHPQRHRALTQGQVDDTGPGWPPSLWAPPSPVPEGWQLLLQIHIHLLEHLLGFDELLFCLGWRGSGVC